jgi:hypothetical protein
MITCLNAVVAKIMKVSLHDLVFAQESALLVLFLYP